MEQRPVVYHLGFRTANTQEKKNWVTTGEEEDGIQRDQELCSQCIFSLVPAVPDPLSQEVITQQLQLSSNLYQLFKILNWEKRPTSAVCSTSALRINADIAMLP